MIDKQLSEIQPADVEALIATGRVEDRRLDYKLQLPGTTDEQKREFLADVASFANGSGGDILYGVDEAAGVPTAAIGVQVSDFDAERLRLQSLVRDGIQPRIPALDIAAIGGFAAGPVILLRIHASWRAPHMVTYKGSSRFFVRDAGQRHQMDVLELRAAFAGSETQAEKIRDFRYERLARILAGAAPVRLPPHPTLALHFIPIGSAFSQMNFDPRGRGDLLAKLAPMSLVPAADHRINLDGLVLYSMPIGTNDERQSYIQIFRNGAIEVVTTFSRGREPDTSIVGGHVEITLMKAAEVLLQFRREINIEGPLILFVTLLRAGAVSLYRGDPFMLGGRGFDRDDVLLPEVVLEDAVPELSHALRPVIDMFWQAAGFTGSSNFDASGIWVPPKR